MIDLKRAAERQRIVDVSNLRFYAQMFIEHKWETQWMSWTVFQQTLQEIASRIEAKEFLQEPPQWISVKDKLPEDGVEVPQWIVTGHPTEAITHWMPLGQLPVLAPAPAEAGQEEAPHRKWQTIRHVSEVAAPPQPAPAPLGDICDVCGKWDCTRKNHENEAQPAPQDVIEKMSDGYNKFHPWENQKVRMTAAYRIAEEHLLRPILFHRKGKETVDIINTELASRRTPEKKEPTLVITVKEERIDVPKTVYRVMKNDYVIAFQSDSKQEAETFAAGLRAEMLKGEK